MTGNRSYDDDLRDGYSGRRAGPDPPEREISLGMPTILGIFFALALALAAVFGLGYTLGRRSAQPPAELTDTTLAPSLGSASKPSAGMSGQPTVPVAATNPQPPRRNLQLPTCNLQLPSSSRLPPSPARMSPTSSPHRSRRRATPSPSATSPRTSSSTSRSVPSPTARTPKPCAPASSPTASTPSSNRFEVLRTYP